MTNATAHHLAYNFCEDEADKTGVTFVPSADGTTVEIFNTYFAGYEELTNESRRTVKVSEARALWAKLVSEVDDFYKENAYTHVK